MYLLLHSEYLEEKYFKSSYISNTLHIFHLFIFITVHAHKRVNFVALVYVGTNKSGLTSQVPCLT